MSVLGDADIIAGEAAETALPACGDTVAAGADGSNAALQSTQPRDSADGVPRSDVEVEPSGKAKKRRKAQA